MFSDQLNFCTLKELEIIWSGSAQSAKLPDTRTHGLLNWEDQAMKLNPNAKPDHFAVNGSRPVWPELRGLVKSTLQFISRGSNIKNI